MMQLSTIEINKKGDVLSVNISENSSIAAYLPKAGSSILSISNPETNVTEEFPLTQIFQSYLSIEFNLPINKQSVTFTAIRIAEDRAILSLKPIVQPNNEAFILESNLEEAKAITKHTIYNAEATLKRFTDNLPLVVFEIFLYPDGKFEFGFVNKEMEKFFPAFNREAINTDNSLLFVRVHPDDKQKLIDSIKDVFRFRIWDIEYRVIEDGNIRWVKGYGRPERDSNGANGNYIKVCTYLQDITDNKLISDRLELIDFTFKNASLPMYFVREDASIYDFNEAGCNNLGYTREELLKLKIHQLDKDYNEKKWPLHWAELKAEGRVKVETKQKKKDGSMLDVIISANFLKYGDLELNCAYVMDITEKKKQEQQFLFFDFMFKNTDLPITIIKKDASFYEFNKAAYELVGYSKEEYSKLSVFATNEKIDEISWAAHWEELERQGSVSLNTKILNKNGETLEVEIVANLIRYGEEDFNLTIVKDITEKKKLSELLDFADYAFKKSTVPTVFLREDASFYDFNEAYLKEYGYSLEEVQHLKIYEMHGGFDADSWRAYWKVLRESGGLTFEAKRKKKDGTYKDVEIRAQIVKFGDQEIDCVYVNDLTEKKLSEKRLRIVDFSFKNASFAMHFITKEGNVYDFNDVACKMLGYTKEEYKQITIFDFAPRHDKESWASRFEELKKGPNQPYTTLIRRKDNTLFHVELRSEIIIFDDIELCFSSLIDITDRLKAETELLKSNERYEYATQATSDVIWEWNIEEDSTYFSPNWTKVFGHPVSGLQYGVDNVWRHSVHPEDLQGILDIEANAIQKVFERWEHEYRIKKIDGEYATVNDRGFAIKDENGKVVRLIGAIQDITEKRKTEKELKMSIERYEYATIATSDVIWETDFEAETFYLTKNFELLFGHKPTNQETLYDNIWVRNVHPDDLPKVLGETEKISNGKESNHWVSEYRFRKANGEYAIVQDKNFAIRNAQGKVIRLVGAIQDITRKKAEEAEKILLLDELIQNNKELKQFSYITTHNLRAPLTNLVSICNLINTDYIEDTRTKKLIEGFKTSTYYLNETLNDLIKVLIIRGNTNLPIEILNFSEILEEVKASIYMEIINKAVAINTDFSDAPEVHFSKPYLSSIFLNLITNSIKYAHTKRYPAITIKTTKEVDGRILMTYSDNGIGMDMNRVKDKIFGLYQRFHGNADSKGIGLFLIHSQITALGGIIEVESEENVGTTFTIKFQ